MSPDPLEPLTDKAAPDAPATAVDSFPDTEGNGNEVPINDSDSVSEVGGCLGVGRDGGSAEREEGTPRLLLPSQSVASSGRFHSKTFQALCLWLAKNNLLLVSMLHK